MQDAGRIFGEMPGRAAIPRRHCGPERLLQKHMTSRTFQSLAPAVEAYYDELRRFIHRRTGSPVIAGDLVQEIWIAANAAGDRLPFGIFHDTQRMRIILI